MVHLAFVIAGNLVPLLGVIFFDWSPATIVVVYWAETLVNGTANVARIYLHRRANWGGEHRKSFFGKSSRRTTYLRSYALFFYWFTIGHGIFLLAILEGVSRGSPQRGPFIGIDLGGFGRAVAALGVLAMTELVIDSLRIADQPFAWLKERVDRSMRRVIMMHLAILGGAILIAKFGTSTSLLVALIIVKTGFDVTGERPS